MHNTPLSHFIACDICTFSSFCIPDSEETPCHSAAMNLVVKGSRKLKRNEVLCVPQEKFHNLYVVQSGILKAYHVELDGKESIRNFYFSGEVVGYESIYTGHYALSVIALSDTVVCEVDYDNFLEFLATHPKMQARILSLISQRMNSGSCMLAPTAEQRLAGFLLELSTRLCHRENKLDFVLPMSRQDIGNYLGLAAETISRMLVRFQQSHVIAVNNKQISLLKMDQLKSIVGVAS